MATLPKVLINRADYQIGGGVALRSELRVHTLERLACTIHRRDESGPRQALQPTLRRTTWPFALTLQERQMRNSRPYLYRANPASFLPQFNAFWSDRCNGLAAMRPKCFFVLSALLLSGCAQVNDQFYSKKNFNSQSFVADMSECKRQNPSFVAIRGYVADRQDRTSYTDDAMVRDCMKGKGYTVELERK
jgi:hypothetical protein